MDDDEPPEVCLEYSDDEQERRAKKKKSRSGKVRTLILVLNVVKLCFNQIKILKTL